MKSSGFFDIEYRYKKIDKNGDVLVKLNKYINWELFRTELEIIRNKEHVSNAGRKPYDVILMFKILILQTLYNLSDDAVEMQILDRLSFMRFLGLDFGDSVPDAKTIWLFREQLKEKELIKPLFDKFDDFLRTNGYQAMQGQIIDASIVSVPKQRNSRHENELIKEDKEIEDWSDTKRRQKDVDARWLQKNNKNYFGYKNHTSVDVKNKFVRAFEVTDASVHDSRVFEEILDENNNLNDIWADSAYFSAEKLEFLDANCYQEHINRKGSRNHPLSDDEKLQNREKSRIRARVEHVYGAQLKKAGNLILRTIGIARAYVKIGLRNLSYNIDRYCMYQARTA